MKPMRDEHLAILRRHMVDVIAIHADLSEEELGKRALDERVLAAMRRVPRHLFVPAPLRRWPTWTRRCRSASTRPSPSPSSSRVMTDLLDPEPDETVLEVGTGLGYQAAVLAELARQVWSVEVVEEFATAAEELLRQLGYANVGVRTGDGSQGWPEHAPFDKIIVTAAADLVPPALIAQLRPGGRHGAADGPVRDAAAHRGREGRGRRGRAARADGRAVHVPGDRARRPPQSWSWSCR